MTDYLQTIETVYRDAALAPADNLCCIVGPPRRLPGLVVPDAMHAMNYGCGSAVPWGELREGDRALYIGVGGGLEALQLAYFTRRPGGVVAIDPVAEMRAAAEANLRAAAEQNDWFDESFVRVVAGDALALPVEDATFDYVAQNCLFNVFKQDDLARALGEACRVLKLGGRLAMSDPITPRPIPAALQEDERLRAECLSGCQTFEAYCGAIGAAGFGTIEVRSRRPYRALSAATYADLDEDLMLDSIDVVAIKTPAPEGGPRLFTGRTATYTGELDAFDGLERNATNPLPRGVPQPICDATAASLERLGRGDLVLTEPTWHYGGGGCC